MPPKKEVKKEIVQEPVKQPEPQIPAHELQGYGRFQYLNGAIYEGRWHLFNGVKAKHGQGILTLPGVSLTNSLGKQRYEGNWHEDQMGGYGTYTYADGAIYRGDWKDGLHNGKGTYQFANGTVYEGEWKHHLMHGTGCYIDATGNKWEGEFRNGKYQSRLQKQLVKEKAIVIKKESIKKQIDATLTALLEAIARSDKKTLKENLIPFFVQGETAKELLKEPYSKFDERPPQKWTELVQILKGGEWKILESNSHAVFVASDRILGRQMEGVGQIVEVSHVKQERSSKLALLNVEGTNWVVVSALDEEKKK